MSGLSTRGVLASTSPAGPGQRYPTNGHNVESHALERLKAATRSTTEVKDIPPPRWLVDGILPLDCLAMIFGPSGHKKTFVALDLALCVATGTWWHGREVDAGPVVYVVGEGASGIGKRIDAWQTVNGVSDLERHHPVHWVTVPVNLYDASIVGAFRELVQPLEPHLIIFDTLARCTVGAEENSAKEMGIVVDQLDQIRRTTGAAIVPIHHTGKDLTAGARGSSSLRGSLHTEIEVRSDEMNVTVKVAKQKDGPEANDTRLEVANAGQSIALRRAGRNPFESAGTELTGKERLVLQALTEIEVPGGITTTTWRDAVLEQGLASRSGFYAAVAKSVQLDAVRNIGTDKTPRYTTSKESPDDK